MSRFHRIRHLSPGQVRRIFAALALLPWVEVQLRWGGLRGVLHALSRVPLGDLPANAAAEAQVIARAVAAATRHGPWPSRCLATALVLQRMLRKQGIESELRIGVRRNGGRLEAHAWVEHNGSSLMEEHGVHERFAALAALSAISR